jgi:hypothetical protein
MQFLDFPNLSTWHSGYIKSLQPVQSGKSGMNLTSGDKIKVGMGMTVTEVIQVCATLIQPSVQGMTSRAGEFRD